MTEWSVAALRIYSDLIGIKELNTRLATSPSSSYEKGEPVSPRNPNSPVRKEALWILNSNLDSSQPLEAHIIQLLDFIEQRLPVFNSFVASCEIELFCGLSIEGEQSGFVLGADLLQRVTALPISLVFDIYSKQISSPQ